MKLALEKLKQNPKNALTEHFASVTHVRHSCNTWYTMATGCIWKITKSPPIRMFQKLTKNYLSQILSQLKAALAKKKQDNIVTYIAVVTGLLKSVGDPQSSFVTETFQYMADLDFLDSGVFWALLDQPNGVIGTKDNVLIKIGSAGATFITDPVVAQDLRVSKCSGIHSTNHCVVPWSVPDQISAALSYAILSGCCPRNTKKERMVLQIAGKNSMAFVKWVLENIVGDYGCHIQSVLDIPKDRTIRVIFFELDSLSKHVPMLLRQVRQRKVHPLLVFVTPDDKTQLSGVDGYWEPETECATLANAKTTIDFLIEGHCKYSVNNCLPTAPDNNTQLKTLLDEFLTERDIKPAHKKTASRMKFAELTEILKNRAIRQGFHLLPVFQKDLVHEIKARHFKIVRPQGTLFFKYTVDTGNTQ